ncbi:unnamed protein product [Discosporangium mesarthrocarpum]
MFPFGHGLQIKILLAGLITSNHSLAIALTRPSFGRLSVASGSPTLTMSSAGDSGNLFGCKWHRSMIRVKDPIASVKYYEELYGMHLVDFFHFPELSRSNYYLASLRKGEDWPIAGSEEAHKRLFNMDRSCIELQHTHGAEADKDLKYSSGNEEPNRGFGHLAFLTDNVYAASEALEKAGVGFKKRPDEGRMKGIAFVYDPDGYWIELVQRNEAAGHPEEYNLGQTMLRVKDINKSLNFYTGPGGLGMSKVCEKHFSDFSLYFLQSLTPEERATLPPPQSAEAYARMGCSWAPVLELTHNHGTEDNPDFKYHDGNSDPEGFGHIGFIVNDIEGAAKALRDRSSEELPEPGMPAGRILRFRDPDGYHVQLAALGTNLEA